MKQALFTLLSAGALATVAFDAYGQGISPLLGMAKLAPVGLASSTLKSVFGASPSGLAHLLHAMTGMVAYVLGYFLIARPLQRANLPSLPWVVTAAAYGVVLWVFALYVMAHLVAGMPAFLGFGGITWVALYGHVIYALVAAWVIEAHGLAFTPKPRPAVAIG
ncbi:hypothetical protein C1J03_21085 [Sulfitobacter sp. SK012]|uniref:hypothetical protein n=1 Tax=Sulfitobacter sp. SK012 TaxID=1389005 RepID=UPI000E0A1B45|nr:hypothetical protein [Sulfitobacter sp. SK012]AXI48267.1 hypothetical protein C1J03_21085 [Sulfitobacter sp. SK012]